MRAKPSPLLRLLRALSLLVVAAAPCLADAHERWVKHDAKPFNRQYFESMSGEVLEPSGRPGAGNRQNAWTRTDAVR